MINCDSEKVLPSLEAQKAAEANENKGESDT